MVKKAESNLSEEEAMNVIDHQKTNGLGKLFRPFIKEERLEGYLKRATIINVPKGSPNLIKLLVQPQCLYVAEGKVAIRIAGIDDEDSFFNTSKAFVPDFRLLKSDILPCPSLKSSE